MSANLIQLWLPQFDHGEINDEEAEASLTAKYEAQIAALERKVGQLTMELDLIKKHQVPQTSAMQNFLRLLRKSGTNCPAMNIGARPVSLTDGVISSITSV
ncbi:hypothetical protein V7795_29610 [Rhizobium laguerreae]|uniref:hypothetical protein n=1 Tax=Rhizobium laguerreae TaxID=1076926 RepID=UPI002FFDEF41